MTLSSVSSSSSSTSSDASPSSGSPTYSRTAHDILNRLADQVPDSTCKLWSAGNVRLNNLDLTIPPSEAAELATLMRHDERFEILQVLHLGDDGGDWRLSFRRTSCSDAFPLHSESE